jgi:alkyl hydroperoxide reductase subunit F
MTDLIIIGGGPAGVSAGVYAARKRIASILITDDFGGQSIVSEDIQNWIGTPHISGSQLAKDLEKHVREYAGDILSIHSKTKVTFIEKTDTGFTVHTKNRSGVESKLETKTVLISTGSVRRKLETKGADVFEHKGLTYCASCDGPFFATQDVIVVGAGNAGLESALQLSAYCKKVYIFNRGENFRGDKVTLESINKKENIEILINTQIDEIMGEKFVEKVLYTQGGEQKEMSIQGIFVEIGQIPNTAYVENLVDLTAFKNIIVDPKNQRTSVLGIWAAGDCTDGLYHQNNIAAGDAVKALEDIYVWLQR